MPSSTSLEVVCLPAGLSVGRSHAWLVQKPDLVWQILTDFLGGRTSGWQPFAFQLQKSTAERHFCADERATRTNERTTTQVSYLLGSRVRSSAEGALLFVRVNEVGRNADKFSLFRPLCRLFADQQTVREEDHRSWSERAGSGLTWFHGKSGGVLRFLSLSPEFRYLAHFMPPSTVATDLRVEREQKEARSTAVKWRPGDRQPREREREKGGGHFGTGRIWTEKGFGPPRGLYLPHIAISSECRVGRSRGGSRSALQKNPNLIQITKATGVNCRRRSHHGLLAAKSTVHWAPLGTPVGLCKKVLTQEASLRFRIMFHSGTRTKLYLFIPM